MRSGVDRWLGVARPDSDPSVGLLLSATTDGGRQATIRPLHRGALIQAGPSATWDLRARLDLTRLWAQRTIGASLSIDHPTAAWWFDEGVAHGVALRVLQDMGVIDDEEVASEVSTLLGQEALAGSDEGERRRWLAVRGALLAVALDGQSGRLQRALRTLSKERAHGGERVVSMAALFAAAQQDADPRRVTALRSAIEGDASIPLLASDIGPCVTITHRNVYRFELGFTPNADGRSVSHVKRNGPADRAGVRNDDVILSLEYADGRSDVAVHLELERDGAKQTIEYHPRGTSRRARAATVRAHCQPQAAARS